ncbi:MAG: ABC transporter ATP-binding protein [Planctomycetota bacterium]|nr:ABC transporter ATP-binding protein [Planctomycetota bacterium]
MNALVPSVECGSRPSDRLLRALAPFGLLAQHTDRPAPVPPARTTVDRVLALPGGSIALLTGPSGCGKSTLLRAIAETARADRAHVIDAAVLRREAHPGRPIIDLFTGPLRDSLRLFAAAGLAEPMLWARAASELSEGQQLRLSIALAMAKAHPGVRSVLLLDECCSTLDRVTARGVARTLRRWVSRHRGVLVVCATAHDNLAAALQPDLVLEPPFAACKAEACATKECDPCTR